MQYHLIQSISQLTLFVDNNSAIGTIIDDDSEPTISLVDPDTPIEVAEGDTGSVKVDIPC